jgi:hypothetical protein
MSDAFLDFIIHFFEQRILKGFDKEIDQPLEPDLAKSDDLCDELPYLNEIKDGLRVDSTIIVIIHIISK